MILADNSSIIGFITSFPYILDIIIVLFLLLGASIGYARGFWRGTFNLVITLLLLLVSWFVLLDALTIFVNTRLLSQLNIVFKVGEYEVTSIEEFIRCIAEMYKDSLPGKYSNPDYVYSLSLSISKSIAWLLVVVSIHLLSWILSGVLYFLIMRLVIPEKLRKVKLRLVGALMGLIQAVVIVFAYMISFSNISPSIEKFIECGEGVFSWYDSNVLMVLGTLNPSNSMLASYGDFIEKSVEGKFSFSIDSIEYKLNDELKEFIELISKLKVDNSQDQNEDNVEDENIDIIVTDYLMNS